MWCLTTAVVAFGKLFERRNPSPISSQAGLETALAADLDSDRINQHSVLTRAHELLLSVRDSMTEDTIAPLV